MLSPLLVFPRCLGLRLGLGIGSNWSNAFTHAPSVTDCLSFYQMFTVTTTDVVLSHKSLCYFILILRPPPRTSVPSPAGACWCGWSTWPSSISSPMPRDHPPREEGDCGELRHLDSPVRPTDADRPPAQSDGIATHGGGGPRPRHPGGILERRQLDPARGVPHPPRRSASPDPAPCGPP